MKSQFYFIIVKYDDDEDDDDVDGCLAFRCHGTLLHSQFKMVRFI